MAESVDMEGVLGAELSNRLVGELESALRRKSVHEVAVASAFHTLVARSERLAESAGAALDVIARHGEFARPLYVSLLRGLVERGDSRATTPLLRALNSENGGGLSTFAAAALSKEPRLKEPLEKLASSRSSPVAFAAEVARVVRGESTGDRLHAIAPRIKESVRIELLSLLVLPLVRKRVRVVGGLSAFAVLRDAERHLGRWLYLAEFAQLAGEYSVSKTAEAMVSGGAASTRAGWSLVAWALDPSVVNCEVRPNLELIARLSDRPSSARDLSFLFRMADAQLSSAKSMLEGLVKQRSQRADLAVRASLYLARDYGLDECLRFLITKAKSTQDEEIRGLAIAVLFDVAPSLLDGVRLALDRSRQLKTAVWSAMVRLALAEGTGERLVTEANYRRLQLGWPD